MQTVLENSDEVSRPAKKAARHRFHGGGTWLHWLPEKPAALSPRLLNAVRRALDSYRREHGRLPPLALLHVANGQDLARVEIVEQLP